MPGDEDALGGFNVGLTSTTSIAGLVNNSVPIFCAAARLASATTCVWTFNVVSTLAWPMSTATTFPGTLLSCAHEE